MNRGIHVSRSIPSKEDLEYTSIEIIKGINDLEEPTNEIIAHVEKVNF